MAKKKFDTNPLDPDYPDRVLGEPETRALPNNDAKTKKFADVSETEEKTRQMNNFNFSQYENEYNSTNVPQVYKTSKLSDMNESSSRKVAKVGLPENILTALPYIPWYIGMIAGLVILFLVPKSEAKVRFHAAQGLAAHLAILLITTILGVVGQITDFADFGNGIFQLVTMVMLIIFAIKAWRGKPIHIESIDDLTVWLEDKIKPNK